MMTAASSSGTAPFGLSVLDNALTGIGTSASEAYREVIALAQLADRRGFQRYWMSEHHAMPGASTSSPQMMLARLTGETQRIRLGAGGIMLPNHSPLLIAEQFGMLSALAPGRIDLGVGRAPGTDQATAAALRRRHDHDDRFPEQIGELVGFLEDDFPEGHPYRAVHAVPGPWQAEQNRVPHTEGLPELWTLGSSTYSAHLAARLGRPYAFALQFGRADVTSALRIYRDAFRPSPALAKPRVMVSVSVAAHDDPEEARRQTSSTAMAMLRMFQRKPYALLSPEEVAAYPATLDERRVLDMYMANTLHGTGSEVGVALERLHEQTSADEIMLVTGGHSREIQTSSVELVADHFGLPVGA
ncbi:LLM class flavin-dependent oxidoreductase [Plantibacter sp. CFBP 13570]|uniref:LLM class flavin-dependent oxidoreductase n=1 Tax=Plantibacter sp. CFBP 13570 TaxID=2775272 RepID=UPI001FD2DCB7|nr:LLM class flavin-dependent oxidoreductase [Plantibacter sp. CFBP 13570]